MKETLQAQDVNKAIEEQIARRERRITELQSRRFGGDTVLIGKLEHAIGTLIELQHVLGLCNCPPEAYQQPTLESEDHELNS